MVKNSPANVDYRGALRLSEQAAVMLTTDLGLDVNKSAPPQELFHRCQTNRGRVNRGSSDDGSNILVDLLGFKLFLAMKWIRTAIHVLFPNTIFTTSQSANDCDPSLFKHGSLMLFSSAQVITHTYRHIVDTLMCHYVGNINVQSDPDEVKRQMMSTTSSSSETSTLHHVKVPRKFESNSLSRQQRIMDIDNELIRPAESQSSTVDETLVSVPAPILGPVVKMGRPTLTKHELEKSVRSLKKQNKHLQEQVVEMKTVAGQQDVSDQLVSLVDSSRFLCTQKQNGQETMSVPAAVCIEDLMFTCGVSLEKVLYLKKKLVVFFISFFLLL